eukprot:4792023-Prymnesium_polylepis.1
MSGTSSVGSAGSSRGACAGDASVARAPHQCSSEDRVPCGFSGTALNGDKCAVLVISADT